MDTIKLQFHFIMALKSIIFEFLRYKKKKGLVKKKIKK